MFLVIRASYYGKEIVERDHVFRFWVVRAGCAFTTYNGQLIINLDANLTLYGLFCCCSGNFHSSFCTVAIFRPELIFCRLEQRIHVVCLVTDDFSIVQ